mgnify:CR=1 FL=1
MLTTNPDAPLEADDVAFADDTTMAALYRHAPQSANFNKLRKRLMRNLRQAIDDFAMLNGQRRWLVCLSGGKDSYGLLALLLELRWRGLLPAELIACNLDQGQPNFPKHILPDYLTSLGIPHRIEYRDTYSIVTEKVPEGATYCSLCSRLRRGNLYRIAREEGCDAVVLGHHREDILEYILRVNPRVCVLVHGDPLALDWFKGHAAETRERRRRSDAASAARLLCRRGPRPLRHGDAVPDHSLRSLRLAGWIAAQRDEGDAQ